MAAEDIRAVMGMVCPAAAGAAAVEPVAAVAASTMPAAGTVMLCAAAPRGWTVTLPAAAEAWPDRTVVSPEEALTLTPTL